MHSEGGLFSHAIINYFDPPTLISPINLSMKGHQRAWPCLWVRSWIELRRKVIGQKRGVEHTEICNLSAFGEFRQHGFFSPSTPPSTNPS